MRSNHFPRSLAALAPALALVAETLAQSTGSYVVDLEAATPSFDVSRMAAVEVTQDTWPDVAVLQEGVLSIAVNPGFTEASLTVPGTFTDITAYGLEGERLERQLLAVGSDGLESLVWDPSTDSVERTQLIDAVADPVGHAAWIDAAAIRLADLDGDGDDDLVGLSASGARLISATYTAGVFTTQALATGIQGDLLDMEAFDARGDGSDDIAVLTTTKLYTFEADGTALAPEVSVPSTVGDLEPLVEFGAAVECLAWLRRMGSGSMTLYVIDARQGLIEQQLDVNATVPRRMAGGDLFGNGRTDLALTSRDGDDIRLIPMTSDGTFSTDTNDYVDIAVPLGSVPYTEAPCALLDLDNDSDLDLVYVRADSNAMFIAPSGLVDAATMAPEILTVNDTSPNEQIWATTVGATLEFHARILAGTAPADATHLEARLWRSHQTAPASGATPAVYETSPHASTAELIPLDLTCTVPTPPITFLQTDLLVDPAVSPAVDLTTDYFFITLRYVKVNGALDTIEESWAHTSRAIVPQGNQDALDYLDLVDAVGAIDDTLYVDMDPWLYPNGSGTQGAPGGTTVGGSGPAACLTDIPVEDVPIEAPPEEKTEEPEQPAG